MMVDATAYKEKARMRSLLKAVVIKKLTLKQGGLYWYKTNPEPLRRMVYDACEKYPLNTRAEYRLDAIADEIVEKIETVESWEQCTKQQE